MDKREKLQELEDEYEKISSKIWNLLFEKEKLEIRIDKFRKEIRKSKL
jgi:hypothetical protein